MIKVVYEEDFFGVQTRDCLDCHKDKPMQSDELVVNEDGYVQPRMIANTFNEDLVYSMAFGN